MQRLVLNIDESRYLLLLQFLQTLDYVKIVKPSAESNDPSSSRFNAPAENQLARLRQVLQGQKPLFQNITDPVAWQKQQRDEWS